MKIALLLLLLTVEGCRTEPTMLPIAKVGYDGFRDGDEIIAMLRTHHIDAVWRDEATKVFPILVPDDQFDRASAILQTNSLVTQGKVQLYPARRKTKDVH